VHPYPHTYLVTANASTAGSVTVASAGLPAIASEPPVEFDGPGGAWSPETLLVGALADCFVLSFRAIARASRLPWQTVDCRVEGTLDRVDGVAQFSKFRTVVGLTVPPGTDPAKARALLEKAEHICLISNSLKGARELELSVVEAPASA
jgi:organic hydroperoxide reductase OsmC/OhrA